MALFRQPSRGLFTSLAVLSGLVAATAAMQPASAQNCNSPNPASWPAPARPYFMLLVDTSGSMTACTTPPTAWPTECNQAAPGYQLNSCGMVPNRLNDAKCALRQTVQAYAGEVNFGMATFASYLSGCTAACNSNCGTPNGGTCNNETYGCTVNYFGGSGSSQCGNLPSCSAAGPAAPNLPKGTWRNGANVVVGLNKDSWWTGGAPPASNTDELLEWFDGSCANNRELFANDSTPLAGGLEGVTQYLRAGWTRWSTTNYCSAGLTYSYPTPLDTNDRQCRSVNVILLTDGDESCETGNSNQPAVDAATDLYNTGVTIGGKTWKVPVYVINFAGGSKANTDAIAAAGGTTESYSANNAAELANTFTTIIGKAIKPEVCNNGDDNCNGCVDEGYQHYCNTGKTCCAWSTTAQRTTCLNNYTASISAANPNGNTDLLPCTTPTQATNSSTWLCYNPGEICDEVDNNCNATIDENQLKCGNPKVCASTELCDGKDNDCDGSTDEGGVCPNCTPKPETCNGCDDDCDGIADDGIAAVPCGMMSPPNCVGTQQCSPPQVVPIGGCAPGGGGLQACTNTPQPEVCDGIDNDCNFTIDDNVPPVPCVPVGTQPGLDYGPNSQCVMGTQACGSAICAGFVGPSLNEICDGIDNNCNGQVDEGAVGVGTPCGSPIAPCTQGTLICSNGALVCSGGIQPQLEQCDNIDNDCDGVTDEGPLTDAPAQPGCWNLPGTCCSHDGFTWCPPAGGSCTGSGTLSTPCGAGTLACSAGAWTCQGGVVPEAEVCDGVDNNCNNSVDDLPGVGMPCGTDVGECIAGTLTCTANGVVCSGSVGPAAEICDNKDNDCDGFTDENDDPVNNPLPGTGQPCGVNQAPCSLGVTACVGGMITCTGGNQPTLEQCDGIDNDCDGSIDEGQLTDAPMDPGCWNIPGTCCSHDGFNWCFPTGGSCSGLGMLTSPCGAGTLVCAGATGWMCQGGNLPVPEVCDGVDNDCDGVPDDGTFPTEGDVCGKDTGECSTGVIDCTNGVLDCVGDVGPAKELCNGLDDDCDDIIDNGIVVGGVCNPTYNTTLYPGPRMGGACQTGIYECDGNGGDVCAGGQGPQPEICDGIDNDCDGTIDETGPAPDGIDGTADPNDPTQIVGGICPPGPAPMGECKQGQWACKNGQFQCAGQVSSQPEACDCSDNDCDGTTDEQDPGAPALCAEGNSCVKSGSVCTCAEPCGTGEFPCPPGQKCETVTDSEGNPLDKGYCVADNCGNCATKKVLNGDGTILCAPAGTPADANCVTPPVCVCKGISGCKNPCDGVVCTGGQVCTDHGPNAGKCVDNNCWNVPCQGCGQACNQGSCATNPCKPDSCPNGTCTPSGDFTTFTCVPTCADKMCATDETCKDGACVKVCNPACAADEICDYSTGTGTCVKNLCTPTTCTDGSCCNPVDGKCGACPCDGVVCPSGQACMDGECVGQGGTGGGSSSSSSSSGGETTSSSSGAGGAGGATGSSTGTGIWGLPTGGGGCSCDVGAKDRSGGFAWALTALALGILRKRASGRRGAKEAV